MSQKTYLTILKSGIYLSFLSLFLVFDSLLFPYITSKQLYFNILIEVLAAIWLMLIIQYPYYRPKFSYITYGLVSFFLAILISTFFSVDFNLSFWGDVERMLGWFHLIHFLVYYFIIITVFRSWEDWKKLFIISISTAVLVSIHGIGQRLGIVESPWGRDRIIATIGNAAYVGAYALFNIFFILVLFMKEKSSGLKYFYGGASFFVLLALIFSGTRGAYLGFAGGLLILMAFYALMGGNKKVKRASIISSLIMLILLALPFLFKDSSFVTKSSFLSRITHISLADATMQTRFISWKAAWKDFPEHPFLGTGYGNYAITFDKYFEAIFYSYTSSETYFDRAHNNLIDIVSTTGLIGLITYLSIFAAAFYYLIKAYRGKKIVLADLAIMVSLIIAYFIQNLVVFDALVTYLMLMLALGYIYWLSKEENTAVEKIKSKLTGDRNFNNQEIAAFSLLGIVMMAIIYQFNFKTILMLKYTIDGQYAFAAKNDFIGGVEAYKKAFSYNSPLVRDSRNSLVRSIISNFQAVNGLEHNKAEEIINLTIDQAEKNVQYNPQDSLNQLTLSEALSTAALFYKELNSPELFSHYSERAEEAINKSLALSPGRVPVYFQKAQIYLSRGDVAKAEEIIKYAVSLNDKYPDGYCHLARINFFEKRDKEAYENLDQCLDKGGQGVINSPEIIILGIKHYEPKQEWKKIIALYERLTILKPKEATYWVDLAKLYLKEGQKEKAKEAAKKAGEVDPSIKEAAEQFIRQVGE